MKRLILALGVFLVFYAGMNSVSAANHYTNFQKIDFVEGGQLLNDINVSDYYNNISKRKFVGWNIFKINNHVKVKYTTETLLDYYNDGTTAIEYEYKRSEKDVVKFGISVSDQMGTELSGTVEKFKVGLSDKLNVSNSYEMTTTTDESLTLKIDIDPGTQLLIYEYGEGYITNGVAASYLFWIRTNRGGFEFFEPSTQYQKIIKRKV